MNEAPLLLEDTVLSPFEYDRLTELEAVIERGRQTFVDVGNALLEIRDSRLYRESHATFEAYCKERWEFERAHAYRLIDSAKVADVLSPMGDTPANERQARELVPLLLEPETLRDAWVEARERAADKPVTATLVQAVVAEKRDPFTGAAMSSKTDLWATPQDLYDQLHAEFGFELDVCATAENAKCATFYTEAEDGLAQPWTGVCWMNPPYGDEIGAWVAKAKASAEAGATVVCLVPARVDTGWWWDNCRYGEIRFLRGRLKFGGGENSAPFPSAVVIFGREPSVVWWER